MVGATSLLASALSLLGNSCHIAAPLQDKYHIISPGPFSIECLSCGYPLFIVSLFDVIHIHWPYTVVVIDIFIYVDTLIYNAVFIGTFIYDAVVVDIGHELLGRSRWPDWTSSRA